MGFADNAPIYSLMLFKLAENSFVFMLIYLVSMYAIA
jgi:hypothetical protein